jgi:hypothetical protein
MEYMRFWLAIAILLIGFPAQAVNHKLHKAAKGSPHEWIQKHNITRGRNAGLNCCDERDISVIPHSLANSAAVGSVLTWEFPTGRYNVVVQNIYETKDAKGRAFLTRWGCLFRWNGG